MSIDGSIGPTLRRAIAEEAACQFIAFRQHEAPDSSKLRTSATRGRKPATEVA